MTEKLMRVMKIFTYIVIIAVVSCICAYYNARERLEFCKNVYKSGDSTYFLSEKGILDSVLKVDSQNKITARASILNVDFLQGRTRNFKFITDDGSGGIYLTCTAYSENEEAVDEVYSCSFDSGIMHRVAEIKPPEGYSLVDGAMYRIYDGSIYGVFKEENAERLRAFVYEDKPRLLNVTARTHSFVDRCFYTPQGIATLAMRGGVWLGDEEIIGAKQGERDIFNGLSLWGDTLCFVNMYTDTLYRCDIASAQLESRVVPKRYELYQGAYVYPDFTVSACYEDGSRLSAVVSGDGFERSIYRLHGDISALVFIRSGLLTTAVLLLIKGIYLLLFVRRRKTRSEKRSLRFISVTARVLSVSLGFSLFFCAVFGNVIYQKVSEMHNLWRESDKMMTASSLYSLSSAALTHELLTSESGELTDDYDKLREHIEMIKEQSLDPDTKTAYSVVGIMEYEGELACFYSDEFYGVADARYAVSSQLLEECRSLFNSDSGEYAISSLADKRSVGVLNTLIRWETTYDSYGGCMKIAFCVISHDSVDRLYTLSALPLTMGVVMLVCVIFTAAAGVVLKVMLAKCKKLVSGIELYTEKRDHTGLLVSGRDEIADAGEALSLMAKSIDIYAEDISEGNRNYKRLISSGLLRLIGQPDISKLGRSQQNKAAGTLVRFVLAELSADLKLAEFAEAHSGCLLDFTDRRAELFFPENASCEDIAAECFDICRKYGVSAYIFCGSVYVGRVGDRDTARLTLICERSSLFENMYSIDKGGVNVLLHIPLYEKLGGSMRDFKLRIINSDAADGYCQLVKIDREGQNRRLVTMKSFSRARMLFEQGSYAKSLKFFRRISAYDRSDIYAGYYLTEAQRKLR